MRKFIHLSIIFCCLLPLASNAQFETFKDSVVQLYGVVMTSDSLVGIPGVSVVIAGQNRGTVSNDNGVFSIVVLKGDKIEFSSIGYKPILASIPGNIKGNQYSLIQLMANDTIYLPATIIKARPTRAQFERDFVNHVIPDDNLAAIRRSNSATTRKILMSTLPLDGREVVNNYMRQSAQKITYAGQAAPMNILNPFAWNEFIKAWKRGDFKNKSSR